MQRTDTELARLYGRVSENQARHGRALVDLAAPKAGETVLDLGCGTGELTVELARRVGPSGRVIAVDPDADRLAVARDLFFAMPNGKPVSTFPGGAG